VTLSEVAVPELCEACADRVIAAVRSLLAFDIFAAQGVKHNQQMNAMKEKNIYTPRLFASPIPYLTFPDAAPIMPIPFV